MRNSRNGIAAAKTDKWRPAAGSTAIAPDRANMVPTWGGDAIIRNDGGGGEPLPYRPFMTKAFPSRPVVAGRVVTARPTGAVSGRTSAHGH